MKKLIIFIIVAIFIIFPQESEASSFFNNLKGNFSGTVDLVKSFSNSSATTFRDNILGIDRTYFSGGSSATTFRDNILGIDRTYFSGGSTDRQGIFGSDTKSKYKLPSYSAPSYEMPSYTAPSYEIPSYTAPSYEIPSYTAPSYEIPSYTAPSYEMPSYSAPSYDFNW